MASTDPHRRGRGGGEPEPVPAEDHVDAPAAVPRLAPHPAQPVGAGEGPVTSSRVPAMPEVHPVPYRAAPGVVQVGGERVAEGRPDAGRVGAGEPAPWTTRLGVEP